MTSFVSKTLKRTQRHDLSRDGSSTSVVDCQVHGTTCRLLCSFLECLFLLGKDFGAYFSWDIGIALCSPRGHRTKNQTCWYRFTTSHCEYEGIPSKPKNPNVESNRWILIRREFLLLGLMILDTEIDSNFRLAFAGQAIAARFYSRSKIQLFQNSHWVSQTRVMVRTWKVEEEPQLAKYWYKSIAKPKSMEFGDSCLRCASRNAEVESH